MLRRKSHAYPIIRFCQLIVTAQAIPSQTSHRATFSKHKSTPKKNPNRLNHRDSSNTIPHHPFDQEPSNA